MIKPKAIIVIDPTSKNYEMNLKRGAKGIQFDDLSIDERYTLLKSIQCFEQLLTAKFMLR
jgi:hypothetical protein